MKEIKKYNELILEQKTSKEKISFVKEYNKIINEAGNKFVEEIKGRLIGKTVEFYSEVQMDSKFKPSFFKKNFVVLVKDVIFNPSRDGYRSPFLIVSETKKYFDFKPKQSFYFLDDFIENFKNKYIGKYIKFYKKKYLNDDEDYYVDDSVTGLAKDISISKNKLLVTITSRKKYNKTIRKRVEIDFKRPIRDYSERYRLDPYEEEKW